MGKGLRWWCHDKEGEKREKEEEEKAEKREKGEKGKEKYKIRERDKEK